MLTIFTSCHNQGEFLSTAIDSVLAQTVDDFEYLLYDDGSSDRTWEVMEAYARRDRRIRAVRLKKARSLAEVLNRSIREAKGDVWTWCPADDVWMPDLLERKADAARQFGSDCVIYADGRVIDAKGNVLGERPGPRVSPTNFQDLPFQTDGPIGFTGIWIPMCVFDRVGPFPERWTLSEDYAWLLRAVVEGVEFRGVPRTLYLKRVGHPSSQFTRHAVQVRENARRMRAEAAKYRDLRFAAAMLTAPRPIPTRERTLRSLARAGFLSVRVIEDFTSRGSWPTWIRAAKSLLQAEPEADVYLLCEDDAFFCRGLKAHLARTLWPDAPDRVALCSPYSPAPYIATSEGWHPQNRGEYLVGSLCWAFPPETLRAIASTFDGTESFRHIDAQVGRWAKSRGLTPWYHTPSLVQHAGIGNSALGDSQDTELRRAADFVGEEEWVW